MTDDRPSIWGVPRQEYRMKNLEWSGQAKLYRDPTKAAPHPRSPEAVDAEVRRRVAEDLAPLFAEGWGYSGPIGIKLRCYPESGRWW